MNIDKEIKQLTEDIGIIEKKREEQEKILKILQDPNSSKELIISTIMKLN